MTTSRIIILGASNAVPSLLSDNTHMLVETASQVVLIDSPGSPLRRLSAVGVDPLSLTDLILTHFHPDHVSGVPLLLMDLWLLGRKAPLMVHGLDYTLDRVEKMMALYDWQDWPSFFPVTFHRLPEQENSLVCNSDHLRVLASPMCHFIPIIGLRMEFKLSGRTVVYSCDTEPCPQDVRLAAGADILLHESTGAFEGHSSAEQAADVATQAGVKSLYLIHYPTWEGGFANALALAQKKFRGPVILAEDLMQLDMGE